MLSIMKAVYKHYFDGYRETIPYIYTTENNGIRRNTIETLIHESSKRK